MISVFLIAAFALSGCSTAGLKKAFRSDPPPAQTLPVPVQKARAPSSMDAFRALAPPEGMKFTQLFAEPLDDSDARFNRLEQSVQAVRDDFDTVVPSLVRLVAVEKDMKDLIGQMNALTGAQPMQPVMAEPVLQSVPVIPPQNLPPNAVPVMAAPQQPQQLVPVQSAPPAMQAIPAMGQMRAVRIGDHGDKTRVVLDLTAKPDYTATIEKEDKQLVLTLPGITWTVQPSWQAKSGDLVSGYTYDNSKVYIDLMSKSKIKVQDVIPGEGGRGYRLVIDLVRLNPL